MIILYKINCYGNDTTREWLDKNYHEHRNYDLPAMVGLSGFKAWCKNGVNHRTGNKPAIMHNSGHKQYWVNGKRIK